MHPTSWRTRVSSRSGPPLRPTPATCGPVYRRRRPTLTPLYPLVQNHLETFLAEAAAADPMGGGVPAWVERDFRAYLRCGILAHGFGRARCAGCGYDFLVAFSCRSRGICPSCNARRMVETAAHLVDHVLPPLPVRQWVLSVPKRLRPFLHHNPMIAGAVLRIFPVPRGHPPYGLRLGQTPAHRSPPRAPLVPSPRSALTPRHRRHAHVASRRWVQHRCLGSDPALGPSRARTPPALLCPSSLRPRTARGCRVRWTWRGGHRLSAPPSRTGWYHGSLAHSCRVPRATRPTHSPATHPSPPLSRSAGSRGTHRRWVASSGLRSSRWGVSRVAWRSRPRGSSALGPPRVRLTEPPQAGLLPRDGPPLSLASMMSGR